MLTCEESDAAVGVCFLLRRNGKFSYKLPQCLQQNSAVYQLRYQQLQSVWLPLKHLSVAPPPVCLHLHTVLLCFREHASLLHAPSRHFSSIQLTDRRATRRKAHVCNASMPQVMMWIKQGKCWLPFWFIHLSFKKKKKGEKNDLSNIFQAKGVHFFHDKLYKLGRLFRQRHINVHIS